MASYRSTNIVLIGTFNPAIFQPEWFRTHELLPDAEIEAATSPGPGKLLVSSDAAMIRFASVALDVFSERWSLSTERPDWAGDLGPLTSSVFELLRHTPIRTIGINVVEHWPKERGASTDVVKKWLPLDDLARTVGTPLRVGGIVRADWTGYQASLVLEPSVTLKEGTYISQNFEKPIKKGVDELIQLLRADWTNVLARATTVVDAILGPTT